MPTLYPSPSRALCPALSCARTCLPALWPSRLLSHPLPPPGRAAGGGLGHRGRQRRVPPAGRGSTAPDGGGRAGAGGGGRGGGAAGSGGSRGHGGACGFVRMHPRTDMQTSSHTQVRTHTHNAHDHVGTCQRCVSVCSFMLRTTNMREWCCSCKKAARKFQMPALRFRAPKLQPSVRAHTHTHHIGMYARIKKRKLVHASAHIAGPAEPLLQPGRLDGLRRVGQCRVVGYRHPAWRRGCRQGQGQGQGGQGAGRSTCGQRGSTGGGGPCVGGDDGRGGGRAGGAWPVGMVVWEGSWHRCRCV